MILEQRQAKRFLRLYHLFVIWAADQLDMSGRLMVFRGEVDPNGALDVVKRVWGDAGERGLVSRYVAENPDRLGRSDLREIESWEEAIYGDFAIVREGRDTVFVFGGHSFAVRGITQEIDDVAAWPLPVFASTAILPFDGLITYARSLSTLSVDMGPTMRSSLQDEAATYRSQGKLARSSRDFAKMTPLAQKEHLDARARDFAHKTELEMNANELAEDQHEGVLVGLDWEEREKAIDAHVKEEMRDTEQDLRRMMLAQLDECCESGKPSADLVDAYLSLSKDELVRNAARRNIPGSLTSMNKRELAEALAKYDEHALAPSEVLFTATREGAYHVESLRRVLEAGGMLRVPFREISAFDDVPAPLFPNILLYKEEDAYVAVMPDTIRDVLGTVDWDGGIAAARDVDEAIGRLECMVDFRGVVSLIEATDELEELLTDPMAKAGFSVAVWQRSYEGAVAFDSVRLDGDRVFFVDRDISQAIGVKADGYADGRGWIEGILDERQGKPPRTLKDMGGAKDVAEWMRERASYRELVSYLDAHVPNGADDYFFAEEAADELVYHAQSEIAFQPFLKRLEELGFIPTEAQLKRLLELAGAVANDVPHWANNGWTPNEIQFANFR